MNEIKDKIIVISALPSGEKDKRILFYGLNTGLAYANLKGVSQAKAKLKFLTQPFCFADAIIFENIGGLSIKTADCLEIFFELTKDYDKYESASLVLETLKTANELNVPNQQIFLETIKTLKQICYTAEILPIISAVKFTCFILNENGFGSILEYAIKSKAVKEIFSDIVNNDDISFIKPNGSEIKEVLKTVKAIYETKLNIRLKSI